MKITERMFKAIDSTIKTLEAERKHSEPVADLLIELRAVRDQAMEELNVR